MIAKGFAPEASLGELSEVAARYAVAITPASEALIDRSDPADPIALQFVPDARELSVSPAERSDPVGDLAHSPVKGVVHRYPDRALLMPSTACASYCRFCFRREIVGGKGSSPTLSAAELEAAYRYLSERPEIWEVILTGGDPLTLSPRRLAEVMAALGAIDHIKIVRLHTRVPAVSPERITAPLVRALCSSGKTVWAALHANHPREMTAAAREACARIIDAGVPMVSQSVLLRGVNDDPATLTALMRAFVEARIKPYYLHQGDLAPGTAHLRTDLETSRRLAGTLRGVVSGLCQPTLVLDVPGGYGKVPAAPSFVAPAEGGGWTVEDPWGGRHRYGSA